MRLAAACPLVGALLAATGPAGARPKPELTPAAQELLKGRGLYLDRDANLGVPLATKAKPVPFLVNAPKRLEILFAHASGEAGLAIDDEVYRLRGPTMTLVASHIGAMPTLSVDGQVVASIFDKKTIHITDAGGQRTVPYHRSGRWEFRQPYLLPDGSALLLTIKDFSQPDLDAYSFLVVDTTSLDYEEIALSHNFVPGDARKPLGPAHVAIQMFAQASDDQGTRLSETDTVMFDFKTHKLAPAPAGTRMSRASAHGKYHLVPGETKWSDDKSCGADETLLVEEGKEKKSRYQLAADTVVSLVDFFPDESMAIASMLQLKSCKVRGVLIPLTGDEAPSKWAAFPLTATDGRVTGRVLYPAK